MFWGNCIGSLFFLCSGYDLIEMNLKLTFCIFGYYIGLFMFCLCFDFPFSLFSYPFVGVCTRNSG